MAQTIDPEIERLQKIMFDIKSCEIDFISQGKDNETGRNHHIMRVKALYVDGTYIDKMFPFPIPYKEEEFRDYDISNRYVVVSLALGDAYLDTRTFELKGFIDRSYGIEIEGSFDPETGIETEHVYVSRTQVTKFDKDFQITKQFARPKYTLRWAPSKKQIQQYS